MNHRLTFPMETGIDDQIRALMERLKVDAVRNSDGTELPDWVSEGLTKVYSTYFPARGDERWADEAPGERVSQYLMSEPKVASSAAPLTINVLEGYLPAQFRPNTECDLSKYWQVIDRTTGRTLDTSEWSVEDAPPLPVVHPVSKVGEPHEEAGSAIVTIASPEPFHEYTVSFLAWQVWDSTQMYNYLTNDWADDPTRVKERPYDVAYPKTWENTKRALAQWLQDNPHVDVVRFTTFFYHFTLVFDNRGREKYVDWFGYSASVSIPALEDFEKRFGYALTPEDFVDGGHYNNPFRIPRKEFLDWIEYTSQVVTEKTAALVQLVHDAGREAIMFYGDNLMGLEPYGPYFKNTKLDGIVGSVGSAATCRMIADVPHVKYTEGRFLPYFFPDVFNDEGDPVGEANESWLTSRRAIVRHPLDRIGYGGYPSLAMKYPLFVDRIEQIINEFRSLHDETGGRRPENYKVKVGILNAWGKLRTWQTHMVAHALWYKQIYSYLGVIESLAGLPFEVEFISFQDVLDAGRVPEGIDVLINAGARDTAFSGGSVWKDAKLQELVRQFVYEGGGIIGIGEPTAMSVASGPLMALSDVFGVDKEIGWTLGHTRHKLTEVDHFIAPGGLDTYDFGEDPGDMVLTRPDVDVLNISDGSIRAAASDVGEGRSVYLAGLPYTTTNARLLTRAILWAANAEEQWKELPAARDHRVEVGYYPEANRAFVYNSSMDPVSTCVSGASVNRKVHLQPMQGVWLDLTEELDEDEKCCGLLEGQRTFRGGGLSVTAQSSLVPRASKYVEQPGKPLNLTSGVKVSAPDGAPHLKEVAHQMLGLPEDSDGTSVRLVHEQSSANPESYRLQVTDQDVTISAGSPAGLVWGLATLRQLMVTEATAEPPSGAAPASGAAPSDVVANRLVPQVTVVDTPRFAWRGLSMDVARSAYTIGELQELVQLLAAYKLNVLHLHLTDDQGWRIEVEGRPDLTEKSGKTSVEGARGFHYSTSELRDLVRYAADRGVQVVPEIDIPGHVNAATHADGSLKPDGQATDRYEGKEVGFSRLHVEAPGTQKFLEDAFTAAAALSEEYVHLGGDEAFELEQCEYDQLVESAAAVVTAAGKRVVAWQEAAKSALPEGALLQFWNPRSDLTALKDAAARGHRVIMSPAPHAYLDMKYGAATPVGGDWAGYVTVADTYDWEPTDQIEGLPATSIIGVEAAMWTETIQDFDALTYMLLPRLAAIAERAWSAEGGSTEDLFRRLKGQEVWWREEGFKFGP